MFARKVAVSIKPNSLTEFVHLMETEILSWLRTQEGFLDLVVLAVTDSSEVATITFWDHQRNAEACNSSGCVEALKILAEVLDGPPYVKTFEVLGSTLHPLAALEEPEAELAHDTRPAPRGYATYDTSA